MFSPTLQVIRLPVPCMERAGVALDALQLVLRLKYEFIHSLPQSSYIFSNTRANFYFATVWFNNNIQEFGQTLPSSIEGTPSCIVMYRLLKVDTILQYSKHELDSRVTLVDKDNTTESMKCISLLLIM